MVDGEARLLAPTLLALAALAVALASPASAASVETAWAWSWYTQDKTLVVHSVAWGSGSQLNVTGSVAFTLTPNTMLVILYDDGKLYLQSSESSVAASFNGATGTCNSLTVEVTVDESGLHVCGVTVPGSGESYIVNVQVGALRYIMHGGLVVDPGTAEHDGSIVVVSEFRVEDKVEVLTSEWLGAPVYCSGGCEYYLVDKMGFLYSYGTADGPVEKSANIDPWLVVAVGKGRPTVLVWGQAYTGPVPQLQTGGECGQVSVEFNSSGTFFCVPKLPSNMTWSGTFWSIVSVDAATARITFAKTEPLPPDIITAVLFYPNGTPAYAVRVALAAGEKEIVDAPLPPGDYVYLLLGGGSLVGPAAAKLTAPSQPPGGPWSQYPLLAGIMAAGPLISLALRRKIAMTGVGLIVYGVAAYLLSTWMGVPPANASLAASLSIIFGIILLLII